MSNKMKARTYLLLTLLSLPVLFLVTLFFLPNTEGVNIFTWSNMDIFFYKNFFLTNIVLFSMGTVIHPLLSHYKKFEVKKIYILLAIIPFILFLFLTRSAYSFYDQRHSLLLISFTPFLIISVFSLILLVLSLNIKLPFSNWLQYPGRYSYPLYLFHMVFLVLLERMAIIKDNDIFSFLIFLISLPILTFLIWGVSNIRQLKPIK